MQPLLQRRLLRHCVLSSALGLLSLPTTLLADGICTGLTQVECKSLASRNVFTLLGDNVIAKMYGSKVISTTDTPRVEGNLIGIDFRPAQGNLQNFNDFVVYGVTDTNKIYTIAANEGTDTLISTLTTGFDGGYQSLTDFNPVANALRLIGSNDQNFAVVNSNGNLNATAAQTAITYAAGDPQAGRDPNLTGGAYSNNVVGATTTIFYALDYARDTLVTIADITNGSSATGGGRIKTIGQLRDAQGKPLNIVPEAGMDIYTDQSVGNVAIISNGQNLYFLNLSGVNAGAPVGTVQNIVVKELDSGRLVLGQRRSGAFMDVAVSPQPVAANVADLSLRSPLGAIEFTNGQRTTFNLQVVNLGPDSQASTMLYSQSFPFKDPVISTSQGRCTLTPLNTAGRGFECNLGTVAFNQVVEITVTVSRLADAFAGAAEVPISFITRGPDGGLPPFLPGDPDSSNNSLARNITVAR